MLNFTEAELCETTVCSESFCCRWSKWDHMKQIGFPDGTTQTCVGAQVRCGCNFAMSLVSYFTYEHPSAVLLTFLFVTTILVYLIIRCIALQESCSIFLCCASTSSSQFTKSSPTTTLHFSPNGRTTVTDDSFQEFGAASIQPNTVLTVPNPSTLFGHSDHPPSYSSVIEDTPPPPPYKECVHA